MPKGVEGTGYWLTYQKVKDGAYDTIGTIVDGDIKHALFDSDFIEVTEWHEYTPEELAEQEESEKREQQFAADREFLDTAPERINGLETGVDDSYDAIAELGGAVSDVEVTLDDVMEAIAELGQIVEG